MSVLKAYFSHDVNQHSPVRDDYSRVVNYDESGSEYITWQKVDYPSLQRSLGSVSDWSLDSLLKAGVDPKFPIHTGNNTRLDGLDAVDKFAAAADAILSSESSESSANE